MKESNLEKKIMDQIKKDQIKMKPKWWYWLKTASLRGFMLLSFLLTSLILSFTVYLISIKTPLELWAYGDIGMQIFFEDFPYIWLIGGLILIGGSVILLSKVGENYKKATRTILLITTLSIIIATILLTAIRIYFGLENYFKLL